MMLFKKPFILVFSFAFLSQLTLGMLSPAIAQEQIPKPSETPLELNLLKPDVSLAGRNVIRADTISQQGLTVPSLWWADEQFGGKLLTNWLAYPNERRVDLVVNRQLWSFLDYIGRYSFVNKMGTASRDFGYNTRVFNDLGVPLATYTCNFTTANREPACKMQLESSPESSLRLRS